MNKKFFIKTIFLTMIGFGLTLMLPIYYLVVNNEMISYKKIQEMQKDNNVKLGFQFRDFKDEMGYKLYHYLNNDYKVISLGNSRVMQFREFFFKKNIFYNLGGMIQDLEDYSKFIEFLPKEKLPEVIILSMDHFFFNDNFPKSHIINMQKLTNEKNIMEIIFDLKRILKINKQFFSDYISNNILRIQIKKNIGYLANRTNSGFVSDGSYYYGKIIKEDPSIVEKIEDSLKRIEEKRSRFELGKEISNISLKEVDNFLKICRGNNIEIIGFLPPYSDYVLEKMALEKENYVYVFFLFEKLKEIFQKYNYQLYDFTSIRKNDGKDNEIIDGFHGTEVYYLRIFIKMLENNKKLQQYSQDKEILKEYLKNRKSEYEVF